MLDRVKMLGYRSGFRKDEDIEMLLQIATDGGAKVMGDSEYGLQVGKRADCVIVAGDTPAQAVIDQPPRTFVVKHGRLIGKDGKWVIP
jgi:cytosine deaminase